MGIAHMLTEVYCDAKVKLILQVNLKTFREFVWIDHSVDQSKFYGMAAQGNYVLE